MTAKLGKYNVMENEDNLVWYIIISFKPGKIIDPNVAYEVAAKIADAVLKGKHEYVLSTHVGKDHVHCHLIFNATKFVQMTSYVVDGNRTGFDHWAKKNNLKEAASGRISAA